MTDETESTRAPRVRDLTRWGVPFHYAPPLAVAAIGLALLSGGGAASWIGGWWLAAALPISIGAFLRSRWFALGPPVLWGLWLAIASSASDGSSMPRTPAAVAVALAVIGAAATLLAQWAIFPATARGAWEPAVQRLATLRDGQDEPADGSGEAVDAGDDDADEDLMASAFGDDDLTGLTLSADALEPIDTDEHAALLEAAERERDETLAAPERVREVAAAIAAEAGDPGDPGDPGEAEAEAEPASVSGDEPEAESTTNAPTATDDEDGDDEYRPNASGDAEPDAPAPAAAQAQKTVAPAELPLDADPTPLDEGGHVTEFSAISEDDLLAAETQADDEAAAP